MNGATVVPYVVGQWVRGDAFYGRDTLIREILDGPRNALWIVGTRRIGKTSLLKEVERLTADGAFGYFPLFWDLQGADSPDELSLSFGDALLDAEDRLHATGIDELDPDHDDLFTSLNRVRRALRSRGLELLLLCDEAEELIALNTKDPALLSKLRKEMQGREGIRTVIASTIRLWALSTAVGDTSPFLHGFSPPLYIQRMTDEEADALVRQEHLLPEDRPPIDDATARRIWQLSDRHPYLTQILAKRYQESHDLDRATDAVANDRMVSYFFSVDYEMLENREREVLHLMGSEDGATSDSISRTLRLDSATVAQDLQRLSDLGFITRAPSGQHEISSFFFRRWLGDLRRIHTSGQADTSSFAGMHSTSPSPFPLGTVADRYQLLQRAGEGASAIVYKAHDRLLDTTVAVKQFKPAYFSSPDGLDRLRKETLLARDLVHAHIVRVYDVGSHNNRAFITMQWIDGPTLDAEIEAGAPLAENTVLRVARGLASALRCAHEKNVLHRDIKPSNILLADGGEPMLGDFGLARSIGDAGITSEGMFLGTPYYSSPEQADARRLDARSDIYSLGVVIFEMATGQRPFEADNRHDVLEMHRSVKARDPRESNPLLSADLAMIIARCLEKEAVRRFQSALELQTTLEKLDTTTGD